MIGNLSRRAINLVSLRTRIARGYLSSAEKIPADSEVAKMAREKKKRELDEKHNTGANKLTQTNIDKILHLPKSRHP